MVAQLLNYSTPSTLVNTGQAAQLSLGTVGGSWAGESISPVFFDGVVGNAGALATAMLILGRVAVTRYYTPPGMVAAALRAADPVLTSTPEGLRFESFSPCAGVYARFDLDAAAVDVAAVTSGVTNVDFNEGMRSLLAGVVAGEPMHLSVASDGMTVKTLDGAATESKVALPERWLRSFAESQVIAAGMGLAAEPDAIAFRALVRGLPRASPTASVAWVQPVASGLRLASSESVGSVGLAGPERLRVIEPLLSHVTSFRAYRSTGAATFWVFSTALGRFTLGLSSQKSRGFSGEGQLLDALALPSGGDDAGPVDALLRFDPHIDLALLARDCDLSAERTKAALSALAAQGLLGYDSFAETWFHRPLPYDATLAGKLNPRLVAANSLVGSVQSSEDGYRVGDYRVRLGALSNGDTCTCPWYGKHRGDRGPCKHVLAARMVQGSVND